MDNFSKMSDKQPFYISRLDVPVTINISPTTPDFFYFQFPKTEKSEDIHVKVTVTSTDEKCTVLSIQPALVIIFVRNLH